MALGVAALVIGALVGLARGGRPRNVGRLLHLRWPVAGVVGLAGIATVRWGDVESPGMLLATSLLLLLVFVLRNIWLRGTGVIAVGLAANLAPLLANGTVPVDGDALVHAGLADRPGIASTELGGGRAIAGEDTLLQPLGKVIPVPELDAVLSFGDLVLLTGLGAAAANTFRRRRPGGVPVRAILEADDAGRRIDLTTAAGHPGRGGRHQRPVEVHLGQPVPVPVGWARDDDAPPPALRGREPAEHAGGRGEGASPHVPWPWRRHVPRVHHPTMRVARR